MKTIDGKYFLLEQSDINSLKPVKRAVGECCIRMDEESHRFVGFTEQRTDAGGVVQYKFEQADRSNWLISKTIQRELWTE